MNKLKTIFGVFLGATMLLGVGTAILKLNDSSKKETKAGTATETTVYYAISTNYSVKCNVNRVGNGDDWKQYDMTKTSSKYDGKPIYEITFTDLWGGLGNLQFQLYDGSTWKSQEAPITSWTTVDNYNGKMKVNDVDGWKTYQNDVYSLIGDFDGHNWDYDVDFVTNNSNHTATLSNLSLSKGDAFKIRNNHDWKVEYGWSSIISQSGVTDPKSRGDNCFGDGGGGNIAVLHDGTFTLSLDYTSGNVTITGTRADVDSDVNFQIFIKTGDADYVPTTMDLKTGSQTEFMITRDFAAGEKFYFKFNGVYYHYSDIKSACTLLNTQFVADGNDTKALYHGNYTIYFETASGNNFGGWLQYNSVSSEQIRSNVITFAEYFNEQVGGACDDQGDTDIEDLQTAWQNTQTRYANEPDNAIKTAIAGVTTSDANADVAEFAGKYDKVYYLRGNSLGSFGGEYLARGITPRQAMRTNVVGVENNNALTIVTIIASIGVLTTGAYMFFKKGKKVEQ